MRHDFIDKYSRLDTPVHRLPAGLKLTVAFLFLLGVLVTPTQLSFFFPVMAVALTAVTVVARIPLGVALGRLLLLEPFVLGVALLALMQPHGGRVMAGMVVKSTLCLATMLLVTHTTPFAEIIRVLRHIKVPSLLITVLALMYRYLFVLTDEAGRMQRARQSRTFTAKRTAAWRSSATLVAQLFVRASERAERIYAAMCARGFE